jgi:putative membrane protein
VAPAVLSAFFGVLWVGGVVSHWLGAVREDDGLLASVFLFTAGLVVLLGEPTRRGGALLAAAALFGFAVEVVGERFGVPFGSYTYTGALRPQLLGVPVVMGPAWMVLTAFSCEAVSRLGLRRWMGAALAALLTTACDLVIDPLAVNRLGYWVWAHEGAYYGIPASNFAGWFFTAFVACRVLIERRGANPSAAFVGAAILLFFALVALANSLHFVALLALGLCAAGFVRAKIFNLASRRLRSITGALFHQGPS